MQDVVEQLKALRLAAFERVAATQDYKLLTELDDMLARLDPDATPLAPAAEPDDSAEPREQMLNGAAPASQAADHEVGGEPVPEEMSVADADLAPEQAEAPSESEEAADDVAVLDDAAEDVEPEAAQPADAANEDAPGEEAPDEERAEAATGDAETSNADSSGLAGRAQALAGLAGAGAVAASLDASEADATDAEAIDAAPVEEVAAEEAAVTDIAAEAHSGDASAAEPGALREDALVEAVAEAVETAEEAPVEPVVSAELAVSEAVAEQPEPEPAVDPLVAAIEQAAAAEDSMPAEVAAEPETDPAAAIAAALETAEPEQPVDMPAGDETAVAAEAVTAEEPAAPSVPGLSEEAEMRPMQEVLAEALGQQPDFEAPRAETPVEDIAAQPAPAPVLDESTPEASVLDQVAAAIQSDAGQSYAGTAESTEAPDQVSALVEGVIDDPEPAAVPMDPPSADQAGVPGELTEALSQTAVAALAEPADVRLDAAENLDTSPSEADQKPDEAYESALSRLNALIERASERMKSEDVGTGS